MTTWAAPRRTLAAAAALALLLGGCGTTTGAADGPPTPSANPPTSSTEPTTAVPLPPGTTAASDDAVVGRWVPAPDAGVGGVGRRKAPALDVQADGTWTASDGCNDTAGTWRLIAPGQVEVTSGPSTLIGCQNVAIAGWWATAGAVATDGDELVLVDHDGRQLVRLVRSTAQDDGPTHGPVTR
ncbi:hypothetical protein GCM10027446_28630 [Angustibacter peucedani]